MQSPSRLVVSLACLLQFGTRLTEEFPQRAFQHYAFRQYEQGKITRPKALACIASKYKVDQVEICKVFQSICGSCEVNNELMDALCASGKKLIGWVDIPATEWESLRLRFHDLLGVFEELVPANFAKLELFEKSRIAAVIDHDVERASMLNCEGWKAILFTSRTRQQFFFFLRRIKLEQIIEMTRDALSLVINTIGISLIQFDSGKETHMVDYFAPGMVATLTAGTQATILSSVSSSSELPIMMNEMASFIKARTPFGFNGVDFKVLPPDLDTMSICTSALLDHEMINQEEASYMLDLVVSNVDEDSRLKVYFDVARPRLDPAALVNVVFLAYLLGREEDPVVRQQEFIVQECLLSGGFSWGTLYYPQPETFLFVYGRLLHRFGARVPRHKRVVEATKNALINLIGCASSRPLDIGKRLLLSSMFGIKNEVDLDLLLEAQMSDGAWPHTEVYALPTTKGHMFNEAMQLCFILQALLLCSNTN